MCTPLLYHHTLKIVTTLSVKFVPFDRQFLLEIFWIKFKLLIFISGNIICPANLLSIAISGYDYKNFKLYFNDEQKCCSLI